MGEEKDACLSGEDGTRSRSSNLQASDDRLAPPPFRQSRSDKSVRASTNSIFDSLDSLLLNLVSSTRVSAY